MAVSAKCAAGWRDGPPDSGVRGRPKRNRERRAERDPSGERRETELELRIGAVFPLSSVGNTVWRITRRPVWNSLAAGAALVARWRPGFAPERLAEIWYEPLRDRTPDCAASQKPSLERKTTWDCHPGSNRPSCRPRTSRWLF